ncbi:MAG: L-aspartate oxidase [Candidatus Latescibacteria bacterium]|nr:L-aspartate oxidase [Candidatus Latescibacterota bacterium]
MNEPVETDVLIIGCGIAGGTTALQLAEAGVEVTLVTRAPDPQAASTYWAQGGIIYKGQDDSAEELVGDILQAGAGLSSPEAATILARQGPGLVEEILLQRLGVAFDRAADGELDLAREGAHSQARIIHVADATGRAMQTALHEALQQHPRITFFDRHTAVDLLTPHHHSLDRLAAYEPLSCAGAYLFDQESGQVICCLARKTVLATGGLGQLFLRTTNPPGARGDGLAMAYRAGARVINCEFVQFHPTTFHMEGAPAFLVSEAVRGDGARLVHADGEPFMQRYDSQWKDLAPRDVVARSIRQEMLARDVGGVFLDLRSYIPEAEIRTRFPGIAAACAQYGIDIARDLVPVVPGAHYACGGVWSDGVGHTSIRHLYAVGEVACTGVHGANRLASTSLLEGLVWGALAARDIAASLAATSAWKAADFPAWRSSGGEAPDPVLIAQDRDTIRQVMWNYVGLIRTTERLGRALSELRHLETQIDQFYQVSELTDGLIGLRNAVQAAVIVAQAAWANKQSVGCHYRV